MKLYSYYRSSASWRVRIALALKGLPYTYVPVHLVRDGGEQHAAWYRAVNPMRQVPTLELEHEGRTVQLAQSLAIIEYLEERYPSPRLLPEEPLARARVRQLAEIVNSFTQPLQNTMITQYVREQYQQDPAAWIRHWMPFGLVGLEALAKTTAGEFAVGDAPTLADCCIVPQVYSARRFGVPLDEYPTLVRIDARCAREAAFQAAHVDAQPDTPPST